MGKRICLTPQQKKEESARQMRLSLARVLAAYKNEKSMTNEAVARELGISAPSVAKILKAEDVCLSLSVTHTLLCMAGYDITKEKRA